MLRLSCWFSNTRIILYEVNILICNAFELVALDAHLRVTNDEYVAVDPVVVSSAGIFRSFYLQRHSILGINQLQALPVDVIIVRSSHVDPQGIFVPIEELPRAYEVLVPSDYFPVDGRGIKTL